MLGDREVDVKVPTVTVTANYLGGYEPAPNPLTS
jgi:hypothetical protein